MKVLGENSAVKLILNLLSFQAGDSSPMTLFIRDAFRESGTTNFFWIDYGPVSRAPCYIQLVQNIKYVSYCLSLYLKDFLQNGMPVNNITCIGHSMGAHICGLLKRYLRLRIKKIIGEWVLRIFSFQISEYFNTIDLILIARYGRFGSSPANDHRFRSIELAWCKIGAHIPNECRILWRNWCNRTSRHLC